MTTEVRGQRSEVKLPMLLWSIFLLVLLESATAQSIILKTGQKIDTLEVRRDGDMVMGKVQVGSGSGEVGYHLAQIAKIEFPEPRGLKTASDFLVQGHPGQALAEINHVASFYEPFKEISGAWWAQAALIKVSALTSLQREAEAESLAIEIQKAVTDPETVRAAQLRLVSGFIRKREFDKAITICDGAIRQSSDPQVLADAWLKKGDALLAQKQWDTALLAYLHIPVFYPDEKLCMPAALLGSARAYWRLDDVGRAKRSFNDLIAAFPKSAEAAVAQSELQKIQKR